MTQLHGPISDRLRKMFTKEEILHNPHPDRAKAPERTALPRTVDTPAGKRPVQGTRLGRPDRTKK